MATDIRYENPHVVNKQKKMFDMECRIKKAKTPEQAIRLFEEYQKLSAELHNIDCENTY